MKALRELTQRVYVFFIDRRGVSTVEYALILVAVIAIVGLGAGMLETSFDDLFTKLSDQIESQQQKLST